MTPERQLSPGCAFATVLMLLLCICSMPSAATGKALLAELERADKYDTVPRHHQDSFKDVVQFKALVRRQSPMESTADEVIHHRMKRHTADHLINDRYSRNIKSHVRKQILAKLLNLVGSSPDNPCKCGASLESSAHSIDSSSSRLKDGSGHVTKRVEEEGIDCNCDMRSLIAYLIRTLANADKQHSSQRHHADALTDYVSRLSNPTKIRLAHFLKEEEIRIRRYEMLRRIRRHRQQMQLLQRRRLLMKDPNAAFRGKNFLSF